MEPINLRVKTEHYEFKMSVKYDPVTYITSLIVGNEMDPCLHVIISNPLSTDEDRTSMNERFREMFETASSVATLSQVKSLTECVHNELFGNYFARHSLGVELIQAAIFIVGKKYPFVKKMRLNDSSYIPCGDRPFADTVDLLIYSIALYGKTWYEKTFNAYIDDPRAYANYRGQIANYTSTQLKNSMTFQTIANQIIASGSVFARQQLRAHYDAWNRIFESSPTLPAFFRRLMETIPRTEKCKFVKGWIEPFIGSKVTIIRDWAFDIPLRRQTQQGGRRRRTRKHKA